ncbi:MAG: hypothetical protein K8F62_06350 [Pseudorhodoplanes sp.]|nr:hypothetical protein [Pseudorhodoplanes sp.]
MKFITGLIVSAVVSLLLMAGAVLALGHVCSPQGWMAPAVKPVPIRFDDGYGYRLESPALLLRVQFAAPPGNAKSAPAPLDWRRNFLCEIKATDVAIAGFGLFLVLSIVFQSLFQGLFMRRVLAASDRTGRVVDDALVAAQRAYVFLREFRVNLVKNPLNEEIATCTIQPIWENTGATPTKNGRSHINWKFFERSIPSEFDFPDFDEVGNRILSYDAYKPLIVGPRATALAPLLDIEPGILRQVRDAQGRVLVWGWAEYDEVFGDARRHRTEFCYQLVVTGSPASWVGFSQYKAYNGVDEDCAKKPTALVRSF